jgi:hypothetical protein
MKQVVIYYKNGKNSKVELVKEIELKGNFFVLYYNDGQTIFINGDNIEAVNVQEKEIDINKRL